jgi:CheY-like chemotaxis protein
MFDTKSFSCPDIENSPPRGPSSLPLLVLIKERFGNLLGNSPNTSPFYDEEDNQDMTKVLVADDEPRLIELYSTTLKRGGFSVAAAMTGVEAIAKFAKEKPDVVVLDYNMPDSDGIEIAAKMLALNPRTIIMMLTADYSVLKEAKMIGIELFLLKPVSMKLFLNSIRSLYSESTFALGEGEPVIPLNCI